MIASFIVALAFFIARKNGVAISGTTSLLITVATTTIVWVAATFLAPTTDRATLTRFYAQVRPAGPGWKDIQRESGVGASPDSLANALLGWVFGCALVYAGLFGTGSLLYGHMPQFFAWLAVFLVSAFAVWRILRGFWL
jgi:solute:Na+ symporter, SSS family